MRALQQDVVTSSWCSVSTHYDFVKYKNPIQDSKGTNNFVSLLTIKYKIKKALK